MSRHDLFGKQISINFFLKYNTPFPFSDVGEKTPLYLRKDILRHKQARLTAGPNFENLNALEGKSAHCVC